MKIGVKLGPATERSLKRVAEEAERAGFDSVWLSERVTVPLDKPHPYQPMADPWIGLSFVAAVTEHVTLGTSVSQIALRAPVLMARELATLDRLSEGRLLVGAGAGWVEEEFTSTGSSVRDARRPAERVHPPAAPPLDDAGAAVARQVLRHSGDRAHQAGNAGRSAHIRRGRGSGRPPARCPVRGRVHIHRATGSYAGQPEAKVGRDARAVRARRAVSLVAQAAPPDTAEEAKKMVAEYQSASVDGIILTYHGELPDAFLSASDVVKALIES